VLGQLVKVEAEAAVDPSGAPKPQHPRLGMARGWRRVHRPHCGHPEH
jgi:hypothetical protein